MGQPMTIQIKEADAAATQKAANALTALIKKQFNVSVDTDNLDDGFVKFTLNTGHMAAPSESSNPNALTPANLSKLIEPMFKEYRAKGWTFTQPVKGSFTIGVNGMNEQMASEMEMSIDTSMGSSMPPTYPGPSSMVMTSDGEPDDSMAIGAPNDAPRGHENITVYANNITQVSYSSNDPVAAFDVVFSVGITCDDGTSKTYQVVKRIGIDRAKIAAEAASGTPVSVVEAKKIDPSKAPVISEAKRFRILAGLE